MKQKTEHTEGPWEVHYSESEISIGPSGGNTGPDFALLIPGNDAIQRANAKLIALSPELLDCVRAMYRWRKYYDGQLDHCAPAVVAEQILVELGEDLGEI